MSDSNPTAAPNAAPEAPKDAKVLDMMLLHKQSLLPLKNQIQIHHLQLVDIWPYT